MGRHQRITRSVSPSLILRHRARFYFAREGLLEELLEESEVGIEVLMLVAAAVEGDHADPAKRLELGAALDEDALAAARRRDSDRDRHHELAGGCGNDERDRPPRPLLPVATQKRRMTATTRAAASTAGL